METFFIYLLFFWMLRFFLSLQIPYLKFHVCIIPKKRGCIWEAGWDKNWVGRCTVWSAEAGTFFAPSRHGGMPLETDGNPARAAQKLTFNASSWDNLSNKCLEYKKWINSNYSCQQKCEGSDEPIERKNII